MKYTQIAVIAACVLFVAGCDQASSDRTGTGQGAPADTSQGTGGQPTVHDRTTTTPPEPSAPGTSRTMAPDTTTPAPSPNPAPDATAKPADNTGRNVRDRSDAAVTPGDQGQSKEDVEITSRARRAITQNDQLSTTAKNIKIITSNGKVTLRGPVNSAAEMQQIADSVKAVQGVTEVDNQLEVKSNP